MTVLDRQPLGLKSLRRTLLSLVLTFACATGFMSVAMAQTSVGADSPSATGGPIRLRQSASEDQSAAPREEPSREAPVRETPLRQTPPRDTGPQTGTQPLRMVDPNRPWLETKPPEFESFAKLPRYGEDMISTLAVGAPDFSPIVPPEYVIQTGDELLVAFWGSVDADLRLAVDRGGRIMIPRVGPVMVAGLHLADAQQAVIRRASQVFKSFEVSVSLGRLRSVRVYVTGFVKRPGAYVLSSLSTAMNAVMRAGGPAESGSFRVIELRRANQAVALLDLYDLLIRGNRSGDKVLQPDDVIHVAAIGPEIAVRGSVNRQAIYEIKLGETVRDALRMAGGFNTVADRSRVALERLEDRRAQRVIELKLPEGESATLGQGDVLRAYSAVEASIPIQRQNKLIKVEGEVLRPGEYVLPPDSTISDALRAAGGMTSAAYVYGTQFMRESVRKAQQENYDRALRDFETQIARTSGTQRVTTAEEAAALTASAAANARLLEQLRALKPSGRIVLQLTPESSALPDLVLEDGDRMNIPPRPNTVGVFGSVFSGGSYLHATSRTVGDYMNLAGGPTRGADKSSVFVVRADGTVSSGLQSGSWFSRGGQVSGLAAEPGDTIFVPEELSKTTTTQDIKDWTAIIYQFGLGVAGIKTALGW